MVSPNPAKSGDSLFVSSSKTSVIPAPVEPVAVSVAPTEMTVDATCGGEYIVVLVLNGTVLDSSFFFH